MNEQIQNLLRQTRAHKHTENLMSNPPQVRYSYTLAERELEKFAELIVEECAKFVDSAISDGGVDGQSVKQHFGVEQ
jgi:hypothetical protein